MNRNLAAPSLLAAAVVVLFGCALPSCSFANYRAERTLDRSESAEGLAALVCTTHNGAITVRGIPGRDSIGVSAQLIAHGESEEDARDHVAQLDVRLERSGNELVIKSVAPSSLPWNASPTFAYTIDAPTGLALRLETHNGHVDVRGATSEIQVMTHNGGVRADIGSDSLQIETHNGEIELRLQGSGPVRGTLTSHNGGIEVDLGPRAAVVEASSHNGQLNASGGRVEYRSERQMRSVHGEGGGELRVETHNGGVRVRSGGV